MVVARRPPKIIALIFTPAGFSQSGSMIGQFFAGAANRLFAWLETAGLPPAPFLSGAQSLPFQSIRCCGGTFVMPSHHTSPASVSATLVKIVSRLMESIAIGLLP